MKQFGKLRPKDEVIAKFETIGWVIDTGDYAEGGDWIYMRDEHDCKRILWSPFNGRFNGTTIAGIDFSHNSSNLDDIQWYQDLLNIFYIEETENVS